VYGVQSGITVSSVVPSSPADRAGLKVGDTIFSVDGNQIKNGDELVAEIAARKPGEKITLGYLRDGKKAEAAVTVADRAKLFAARLGEDEDSSEEAAPKQSKIGVTVRALTPELADRLGIASGKGVIVQDVKGGSFADDVGLTRGDVVLEINKQPVNTQDDFDRVQSGLKSGQDVVFLVRQRGGGRNDGTIFLAGTLP
jgi:serine protease Do